MIRNGFVVGLCLVGVLASALWFGELDTSATRADASESRPLPIDLSVLKELPLLEEESTPPSKYKYFKTIHSKVTAYTPGDESCGVFSDGKTSIGQNAWKLSGVATAPDALPYGSWVYIPGIGYREVDDTGSAMRNAWNVKRDFHIDVRFDSVKDARKWGVKYLNVHVFIPEK